MTLFFALVATLAAPEVQRARYLMGTTCEISADSARDIDAAFAEAVRIERFLSTWREDSELSRLNRTGSLSISPELRSLLQQTLEWRERTGGAFNPLVRPLIDLWKTRAEGNVPSNDAIAEALARMTASSADLNGAAATLRGGAAFEDGAFGKGYAIDRMLPLLRGAHAMVNFGGQLAVRGSRVVTIADPQQRDRPILQFTLADASLSTSSGSEKTFTVEGRTFTHIFDPRTGAALPPRGSASTIADDALTADITSTALYVMGADEGIRWADENGVAALFITTNNEVRTSCAFRTRAHDLQILDHRYTERE